MIPQVAVEDAAAASRVLGRSIGFVSALTGGEHARTSVVTDGSTEFVVRRFPVGDPAVEHEVGVLGRLGELGALVPRLVAADLGHPGDGPLIITTRVPGYAPAPRTSPAVLAVELAAALARIHTIDGTGFRRAPIAPPTGVGPLAVTAQAQFGSLDTSATVMSHYDYWCGNTLWLNDRLTGVVDWSGARDAPRARTLRGAGSTSR